MSKRTQQKKGQSTLRKVERVSSKGNFWVPTTTEASGGKVYRNVKAVRFTPMEPMAAAIARELRKQKNQN